MARFKFLPFFILFLCCYLNTQLDRSRENFLYTKALKLTAEGKFDNAFAYLNRAIDVFQQQKDSLGVGKCYLRMAMISTDKGDYFGGQELSLNARSYFNPLKKFHHLYILSNLNNLGLATYELAEYQRAITIYRQALKYTTDVKNIIIVKNNIANTYRRIDQLPEAIKIYNEILSDQPDEIGFAKTLSNLAYAKWLQNSTYNAAPELLKALQIRLKENNPTELNASYSHLTEFYAVKNPNLALDYAVNMYEAAKKENSANDQLQALQKLIVLSPPQALKVYFRRYMQLDDSVQIARTTARNQFALIRYDFEKSKAELQKSRAETIEKKANIFLQNIMLGILAVAIIIGIFWYRRRRKGLQQEKELEVKNTELRYTKKVHDHVANKVYNVMSEVEYVPDLDRNTLLDKLDLIYKISRDISYERKENYGSQFAQKLSEMLNSYSPAEVLIAGNQEELWYGVNETCKSEVFAVLQELMTNMKRHSGATLVSLNFRRYESSISIQYSDNGKGMKDVSPINGLKNTETRIQNILGSITFENGTEKGLSILISFPFT